ncbi:hypothetical protein TI39_contig560g00002 [Zymoseptoria brevis]|uniref:Pentatricopeptide repeat protein n=1 Tax=Zymoseptoria brevis TaxID=1047168 RepID=A0A0F4GI30_9PEZI|nr:hypothetical protein TI39_contig560g00002 [Zymoseptoria brevis]
MPPCLFTLRSLLIGSRSLARHTTSTLPFRQSQWRPILRHHGTAAAEKSRDDGDDGDDGELVIAGPVPPEATREELITRLQDPPVEKKKAERAPQQRIQPETEAGYGGPGSSIEDGTSTGDVVKAVSEGSCSVKSKKLGHRRAAQAFSESQTSQTSAGEKSTAGKLPKPVKASRRKLAGDSPVGAQPKKNEVEDAGQTECSFEDAIPPGETMKSVEQAAMRTKKTLSRSAKSGRLKHEPNALANAQLKIEDAHETETLLKDAASAGDMVEPWTQDVRRSGNQETQQQRRPALRSAKKQEFSQSFDGQILPPEIWNTLSKSEQNTRRRRLQSHRRAQTKQAEDANKIEPPLDDEGSAGTSITTAFTRKLPQRDPALGTSSSERGSTDTKRLHGGKRRPFHNNVSASRRPRFRIPSGKSLRDAVRSQHWDVEYRKLDMRYAENSTNTYLQDPGPPRVIPGTEAIVMSIRSRLQKAREMREMDEDLESRSDTGAYTSLTAFLLRRSFSWRNFLHRWNSIALWFLYHDPEYAIDFLAASSASKVFPLRQNLGLSIQHLVLHFRHCQDEETRDRNMKKIAQTLPTFLNDHEVLRLHFTQGGTIRHLMPYWTSDQIDALWLAIQQGRLVVLWHTLLHLARYFIDNDQFSTGLDVILAAKAKDAIVDSYAFRSSCAHLLRVASTQPSGLRVTLRLVDNFVAMGLTLNLQMCNIVILNAIDAGDLNTAFSLYRSLVQNGLEADDFTYGILLKGCRGIDDADVLNETIRSAIGHVNVQRNERLATEILHCLNLFHTKKDPENVFNIIADAYTQLFDAHPLRLLGVLKQPLPSGVVRRMAPSQYVLGVMLSAYLNHVHRQTKTHHAAREVYDRYRELVLAGTEPFASSISTDYLPNLFLHSFIRTEQGLLSASQVIKDMQRPTKNSNRVKQCPPSVQSWTIFASGFTRHGKMELAEQVLTYMRKKNLEPDAVTWNVLVKGYAARQDEVGLLASLNRLEDGGHEWTQATVAGMRWYRKQEQLGEVLKRKEQKALELDFVTDLKSQLTARFQEEDDQGNVEYKPLGE